jgi:primosomal protein N' (replication factor Y) (superfamily II helicase)
MLIDVLVDLPIAGNKTYTYRVPEAMSLGLGAVVAVPFGPRVVHGFCTRIREAGEPTDRTRDVLELISPAFFPEGYWHLLIKVADYYLTPLSKVLETVLPPGVLTRTQRRVRFIPVEKRPTHQAAFFAPPLSPKARAVLAALEQSPDLALLALQRKVPQAAEGLRELQKLGWVESFFLETNGAKPKRQKFVTLVHAQPEGLTARQREVLHALESRGGSIPVQEALSKARTTTATLQTLAKLGRVTLEDREVLRFLGGIGVQPDQPKTLTMDQQKALAQIQTLFEKPPTHLQALLHGVTGSGKTEVYLQTIAPVLAQGCSALVLVPEIGLTPQLTDRFEARFPGKVRVYHSALSDGERYDTWRQMLTAESQVIVGTRSAVFAPLQNLGLIILDEEHDGSYKQDQPQPCYHARTVAQWRSSLEQVPLVLGSATPAIETFAACTSGKDPSNRYCALPERVEGRPMPVVDVVDMREELADGNFSPFSRRLQNTLSELQTSGEQGILFLNRRGYSSFVMCRGCGYAITCPHCAVSLTYHQAGERLRCHYCNHSASQPEQCPVCRSPYLKHFGSGTQRIEESLAGLFPGLVALRYDRDTTTRKGSHRRIIDQFQRGEAQILIGTQMLTKGLDLPEVTLVGILVADGMLNLPDFRASERAFQTLTQVSGRAGRGNKPGRVILQTYSPDHPVIHAVQSHAYEPFIQQELEDRRAFGYPPFVQLVCIHFQGSLEAAVIDCADSLSAHLRLQASTLEQLGPAPCTIEKVKNQYRWQLLLKNAQGSQGYEQIARALALFPGHPSIRISVDVDPLRIL